MSKNKERERERERGRKRGKEKTPKYEKWNGGSPFFY